MSTLHAGFCRVAFLVSAPSTLSKDPTRLFLFLSSVYSALVFSRCILCLAKSKAYPVTLHFYPFACAWLLSRFLHGSAAIKRKESFEHDSLLRGSDLYLLLKWCIVG